MIGTEFMRISGANSEKIRYARRSILISLSITQESKHSWWKVINSCGEYAKISLTYHYNILGVVVGFVALSSVAFLLTTVEQV